MIDSACGVEKRLPAVPRALIRLASNPKGVRLPPDAFCLFGFPFPLFRTFSGIAAIKLYAPELLVNTRCGVRSYVDDP